MCDTIGVAQHQPAEVQDLKRANDYSRNRQNPGEGYNFSNYCATVSRTHTVQSRSVGLTCPSLFTK